MDLNRSDLWLVPPILGVVYGAVVFIRDVFLPWWNTEANKTAFFYIFIAVVCVVCFIVWMNADGSAEPEREARKTKRKNDGEEVDV